VPGAVEDYVPQAAPEITSTPGKARARGPR